jgi:hypothetical protein
MRVHTRDVTLYILLHYNKSRVNAQAVSRRPLTAEDRA